VQAPQVRLCLFLCSSPLRLPLPMSQFKKADGKPSMEDYIDKCVGAACVRLTTNEVTMDRIHYSERYSDDSYEYRHVILPKGMLKYLPQHLFSHDDPNVLRLLSESEWRGIGITQSLGWEHYEVHGARGAQPQDVRGGFF